MHFPGARARSPYKTMRSLQGGSRSTHTRFPRRGRTIRPLQASQQVRRDSFQDSHLLRKREGTLSSLEGVHFLSRPARFWTKVRKILQKQNTVFTVLLWSFEECICSPPARDRTWDHRLKRALLYQLSYGRFQFANGDSDKPKDCAGSLWERKYNFYFSAFTRLVKTRRRSSYSAGVCSSGPSGAQRLPRDKWSWF